MTTRIAKRMDLAFLLVRCQTVVNRTYCPKVIKKESLLVKKILASVVMILFLSRTSPIYLALETSNACAIYLNCSVHIKWVTGQLRIKPTQMMHLKVDRYGYPTLARRSKTFLAS